MYILFLIVIIFYGEKVASAVVASENQISGISNELKKNVLLRLKDNPDDAPTAIQEALAPFGYFKPIIHISQKWEDNRWQKHYHIQTGPQMRITEIDFRIMGEGRNHPAFEKLKADFPLIRGNAFSSEQYEATKRKLLEVAEKSGFLTPSFKKHLVVINIPHDTSLILLHFDTGPRYYFGPILFSKNPLHPEFLKRYANFKTGQPYSDESLQDFQEALSQTPYFKNVSVERGTPKDETNIPIHVRVSPHRLIQYRIGLGYGTDTGARATLGVALPYVNAWGHHFSSLIRVSQVQRSGQISYLIPGAQPRTEYYSVSANLLNTKYPQGNSIVQNLEAKKVNKYDLWEQTISLTYQRERYQLLSTPYRQSTLFLPTASWQYLKTDNPIYPNQGYRVNLMIRGSHRALLSDTDFIQGRIEQKYIQRLNADSRILLRGTIGYTAIKKNESLPLSLNFFAGGTQSVRGYTYQSLGPGRTLLVGSAEYQHRIKDDWHAALFFDAGNASDSFRGGLKKGLGIGLVWVSPIGPINIGIAKALNLPGKPLHFEFSMGADL